MDNRKVIYLDDAIDALMQLPSAQPEEIFEFGKWYDFKRGYVLETTAHSFRILKDVEAVKALPSAQPEQQWIPCSERLPKEEKRHYWICTDTGYQCQCRWTDDVYGLGASDRWNWKIFDIPQYQKVVAWMPLPEPYKER